MLKNELDHSKETYASLKTSTDDTETALKTLERQLKEKEWELKDTIAIKDSK